MKHLEKVKAIQFIKPNAQFVLNDDKLIWLDTKQTEPTEKEIEAGFIACQAAEKIEAEAKATAKSALLDKLGINDDELRLLLG